MLPTEVYIGRDGSLYKIRKLSDSIFFRYEELLQEEIDGLVCLLHNNNSIEQKSAGFGEPAADDTTPRRQGMSVYESRVGSQK